MQEEEKNLALPTALIDAWFFLYRYLKVHFVGQGGLTLLQGDHFFHQRSVAVSQVQKCEGGPMRSGNSEQNTGEHQHGALPLCLSALTNTCASDVLRGSLHHSS